MLLLKTITLTILISKVLIANTIPFQFYGNEKAVEEKTEERGNLKVFFKGQEGLVSETLKGGYWNYEYKLNTSRFDFLLKIKKNLETHNATLLFQGEDYLFFKFYNKDKLYWGKVVYFKSKYTIELLEEKSIVITNPLKGIILKNLKFDSNKAILQKGAEGEIERIFQFLVENNTYVVEIQGYTDSSGDDKANLLLSQKRANRVINLLIERGITKERVESKGYGEMFPIADNATQEGRRINRRVELKVLSR